MILLLAATLLGAAEVVSLWLLVKGMGEHQSYRTGAALDRALLLMPKIADWVRSAAPTPGTALALPWIEPFDQLAAVDPRAFDLDESGRKRLESGELVVVSRVTDPNLSVLGLVRDDRGPTVFRLTETGVGLDQIATDRLLIGQHALVFLCALAGFALAALGGRGSGAESTAPGLRAYEEAMSRLRLRDDARLAAFDREKLLMSSILRDREAMARAGELTAGIVHEVRNSMGVIAAQAKFAEKSDDERARGAAASIADELRTLQSGMNRFLDFIRTEEVHLEEFDLGRLVDRVAGRERANRQTSIEIEGVETRVLGDEDLLERAIENVLRNACQAAGEGGLVVVRFGADATHAFVIIEDNGPGIADVQRVLRPFESGRAGGLGLGLPLVLKILTLHHGSLDLGPRPGGAGTQAICRWPKTGVGATTGNQASSA